MTIKANIIGKAVIGLFILSALMAEAGFAQNIATGPASAPLPSQMELRSILALPLRRCLLLEVEILIWRHLTRVCWRCPRLERRRLRWTSMWDPKILPFRSSMNGIRR